MDGGRGNYVSIYSPGRGETHNYFHMNTPALVATGEKVRAGRVVGYLGCTGSCYGAHLHFEVRDGRSPLRPGARPAAGARLPGAGPGQDRYAGSRKPVRSRFSCSPLTWATTSVRPSSGVSRIFVASRSST